MFWNDVILSFVPCMNKPAQSETMAMGQMVTGYKSEQFSCIQIASEGQGNDIERLVGFTGKK